MKKLLLATLCFLTLSVHLLAQSNNVRKFGIGIDIGGAVGPLSARYNSTLGGSLSYQVPVSQRLALTAVAGYQVFMSQYNNDFYTGEPTQNYSYSAVPIKAGLKYYLGDRVAVEGQVGASLGTNSEGKTGFVYSPGISFDLAAGFGVGIRYESWVFKRRNPDWNENLNQIAMRLGFSF